MRVQNLSIALLVTAFISAMGWAETGINIDPWGKPAYPNLLNNYSFEAPRHARRMHLATVWGHLGKLAVRHESIARTGSSSMMFTGEEKVLQSLTLKPDTEYILSAWMKADSAGFHDASLSLESGRNPSTVLVKSDPVELGQEWTQVRVSVKTPEDAGRYAFCVTASPKDGARVWVDDVSLAPADGNLDIPPAPQIIPDGGTFTGPATVTLKTDYPQAVIRYTLDGMEVTRYSTMYKGPINLNSSGTLRAKVFHDAAREGEEAKARFTLEPVTAPGVPFYAVDWEKPVQEWWKQHVYNPESPNFVKDIVSPMPRVNVADVRDANPDTNTAGILEALAQLPETGGTLWFPKDRGPYVISKPSEEVLDQYRAQAQVPILRRSNIHLLSDGAEIVGEGPVMFVFASMNYRERRDMLQNPITNFYVNGLVFNGLGKACSAFWFLNAHNVLVEDCVFRGFTRRVDIFSDHEQVLLARGGCDNFWVRHCRFEAGAHGTNMDGIFNGGVIDNYFGPELTRGAVRFQMNTDMNPTARMHSPVMRISRYVVVANNTFEGRNAAASENAVHTRDAILGAFADTLLVGNRVNNYSTFLSFQANIMPAHNWPHFFPGGGLRIIDNTLINVPNLLHGRWQLMPAVEGTENMVFENNKATGVDTLMTFDQLRGPMHDIVLRKNRLSGPNLPQIVLPAENVGDIRNTLLINNIFEGKPRPMVVNENHKPVNAPGITLKDNSLSNN